MIPFDEKKPDITSGIRIGTSAITTRGIKEKEIELVFEFIHDALKHKNEYNYLLAIKEKVKNKFMEYPITH